jgi:hypothetical protein
MNVESIHYFTYFMSFNVYIYIVSSLCAIITFTQVPNDDPRSYGNMLD